MYAIFFVAFPQLLLLLLFFISIFLSPSSRSFCPSLNFFIVANPEASRAVAAGQLRPEGQLMRV